MGGLPSTITNESIVVIPVPAKISCHEPEKNMEEAVTRDMASFDWLNDWRTFISFPRKVYLKINPFVTVLGQDRKVFDQHSYLIHSCEMAIYGLTTRNSLYFTEKFFLYFILFYFIWIYVDR